MGTLTDLGVLERVSGIPTATFFEQEMNRELEELLRQEFDSNLHVNVTRDCFGNLLARFKGSLLRDDPKGIAFVVHTDHPAFHLTELKDGTYMAKLMGGLNKELISGAEVQLHKYLNNEGLNFTLDGRVIRSLDEAEGNPAGRYIVEAERNTLGDARFATLKLPGFEIENGRVKAPVLDDYASIAMSIAAFRRIADENMEIDAYLVFHRAEEVGFIGAHTVATGALLPKDTLVYSVETSSHRGKRDPADKDFQQIAEVGKGVVLRTGDKITPAYNTDAIALMHNAALEMPADRVQEMRMFAGSCEASLYFAHGYRAAGVCIPLVGWHNDGKPEGVDSIMREEVALHDLESGTKLLMMMAATLHNSPHMFRRLATNDITPQHTKMADTVKKMYEAYHKEGLI